MSEKLTIETLKTIIGETLLAQEDVTGGIKRLTMVARATNEELPILYRVESPKTGISRTANLQKAIDVYNDA